MREWLISGLNLYFLFVTVFVLIAAGLSIFDRQWRVKRGVPRGQSLREALLSLRGLIFWAAFAATTWELVYIYQFPHPVNFENSLYMKFVNAHLLDDGRRDHRGIETSWLYYPLWIVFVMLAADATFYWTHRLLHWGPLYKSVHSVHHRFVKSTSWSAYSFHYAEAILISFTSFFIPAMLAPIGPTPAAAFSLFAVFWASLAHSGLVQKPWSSTLSKYIYSPAHHRIHHATGDHNFGLYFTFWDRVFETENTALNLKDQP